MRSTASDGTVICHGRIGWRRQEFQRAHALRQQGTLALRRPAILPHDTEGIEVAAGASRYAGAGEKLN